MLNTRDAYIERIKKELLGPGSEVSIPDEAHELISNSPHTRYSIGILFPRNNKMNAENDDTTRAEAQEAADDGEHALPTEDIPAEEAHVRNETDNQDNIDDENLDEEISLAAQNMPSSVGITFFARGNTDHIRCNIKFGTYRHAKAPDCKIPFFPENPNEYRVPSQLTAYVRFDPETSCLHLISGLTRKEVHKFKEQDFLGGDELGMIDALYKLCSQLLSGFVREPHDVDVDVLFEGADYVDNNKDLSGTHAKLTALRRRISDNLYSVTIVLVNDDEEVANGTSCIFQPEITVNTDHNDFIFCEYAGVTDPNVLDDEEKSLELQYRNKKVYATGLGTSAKWDIDEAGHGVLTNDFFPEVEVPNMDFNIPADCHVDKKALSMKFLSDLDATSKAAKISHLKTVIDAYSQWIDKQRAKLVEIDQKYGNKYHEIAEKNLAGCNASLSRMFSGIKTLEENDQAWHAFLLANRAMFMQRAHLKIQGMTSDKDRFPGDEELENLLWDIDYRTIDQTIEETKVNTSIVGYCSLPLDVRVVCAWSIVVVVTILTHECLIGIASILIVTSKIHVVTNLLLTCLTIAQTELQSRDSLAILQEGLLLNIPCEGC